MTAPIPALPQRPADVPDDVVVDELLDAYQRHLFTVTLDRPGTPGLSDEQVARHALAALALGQAVVDTFAAERWPLVRRGLAHGATRAQIGAALGGLEVDEIAAGLASWADREHDEGRLAEVDWIDVRDLAAGGAR